MSARLAGWARRHPLVTFYLLSFVITWSAWLPQAAHARGLFPFTSPLLFVAGGVGPLLAAFIVMRALRGERGEWELLRPLWRWHVGIGWYAVALLGSAILALIATGIFGRADSEGEGMGAFPALLPVFLLYLIRAIPEEVAWRGFALPRLQARHSALVASLIVGVLWGLWHLPLLLGADEVMSTYPPVPFLIGIVGQSILYTWLLNNTHGSLLIVTIFHAALNTVGRVDALQATLCAETTTTVVVAAIIVLVYGPVTLARGGKHTSSGPGSRRVCRRRTRRGDAEGLPQVNGSPSPTDLRGSATAPVRSGSRERAVRLSGPTDPGGPGACSGV